MTFSTNNPRFVSHNIESFTHRIISFFSHQKLGFLKCGTNQRKTEKKIISILISWLLLCKFPHCKLNTKTYMVYINQFLNLSNVRPGSKFCKKTLRKIFNQEYLYTNGYVYVWKLILQSLVFQIFLFWFVFPSCYFKKLTLFGL